VAIDLSCDYLPEHDGDIVPKMHTSNIAIISPSVGGVGYNVALATQLAGTSSMSVSLRSFVADDPYVH
jgi:pseudouridine-5'-phosphate glycosidase/pseudouridine kinase